MSGMQFDKIGFQIDGREQFLVSGEFHYFRVPAEDWKRRMELFREAGGNCLATYVPWLIHEPEEGQFVWDDVPNRNLFTSVLEDDTGRGMAFVMNLYSSPQSAELTLYHRDGKVARREGVTLKSMEVATLEQPPSADAI